MVVVDITIARHGQTMANAKGLLQGALIDCDLNDHGIQQAQLLAKRLKDEPFDWIIASELVRAVHTAQIAAEYHEVVPLTKDKRLGEVSWGDFDGTSIKECNPTRLKVINRWANGDFDAKLSNGESAGECRMRITEAFNDILKEAAAKGYKSILVCLHGRIMRVILATLVEKDLTKMDLNHHTNCAYYKIQVDVDTEVLARDGVDGLAFRYILKDVRDHLKPAASNDKSSKI
ncbi:hypothetical protein EV175_005676 [Coemansia sp. RSA 1933]|nr:hypothetical protein EV175_005676 [Coemansia sp. RSA 1933]